MTLSKRERLIFIVCAAVLGLLALDHLAISPLLASRDATSSKKAALLKENQQATSVIRQRPSNLKKWRQMSSAMKANPSDAESQVLDAVQGWIKESGVVSKQLRPDTRAGAAAKTQAGQPRVGVLAFLVEGAGRMESVHKLLHKLQTAPIPLSIDKLQIDSAKPGVDELTISMTLTTAYRVGGEKDDSPAGQPAPAKSAVQAKSLDSYKLVVTRNIFAKDRTIRAASPPRTPRTPYTPSAPQPRDDRHYFVLRGLLLHGDVPVAFFEDTRGSGSSLRLTVGDKLAGGSLAGISLDGALFTFGDRSQQVRVGQNLAGMTAGTGGPPAGPTGPVGPATPAPTATQPQSTQPQSTQTATEPDEGDEGDPNVQPAPPAPTPSPTPSGAESLEERMRKRRLELEGRTQ